MKNSILLSDLILLIKVYAPKDVTLFIFDPFERLTIDTDFPLRRVKENSFKLLVNLADEIICYKGMQLSEFDLIIDFGESKMPSVFSKKELSYINNPEEGMRWVYGNENNEASFLNFYNTATTRAKVIAKSIKLAFKLGLQNFVRSGGFTIYHQKELSISSLLSQIVHSDYSLFMGTSGPNRTLLLELNRDGVTTHFIKIPANKQSAMTLKKEEVNIRLFNSKKFTTFKLPKVADNRFKDVLIVENIKPGISRRTNRMLKPHFAALTELILQTTQFYHLKSTDYWRELMSNLLEINQNEKYSNVVKKINQLKDELQGLSSIYTSLSHGDFTPWNIYVGNQKIHLYDFEQSNEQIPLLNDLFHFHFQAGVLSERLSISKIRENIKEACNNERIASIIKTFKIDIDVYFKLYLLRASAANVKAYQKQKVLSVQHQWLLSAYEEMLIDVCAYKNEVAQRTLFIEDFNAVLKRTAHAYLKFTEGSLKNLKTSSDLDILVLNIEIPKIVKFCKKHTDVRKTKVFNKSFMTTVELYFNDRTFLSLDLIHQFKRKELQLFDARPLLISAMPNSDGFVVPAAKYDFEYCLLFYVLNGSTIPKKYINFYKAQNIAQKNRIFNYIKSKYKLNIKNLDELLEFNPFLRLQLLFKVENLELNTKLNQFNNKMNYILDSLYDMFCRRGLVITFSGVDGAGKTTIIGKVKKRLESKYRKEVVLLRHRPGILPILSAIKHGKDAAEEIASVTMPRKGNDNSVISSLVRFGYYFIDYMIGQVYVYFKYVVRGKIVLYDRYYFDFINDAKRSNIQLNRSFLKAFYRFVFKPKMNFFLYADADIILARKKEMNSPEIDQLTVLYKKLFGEMNRQYKGSYYTIIENKQLDVTLNKIMNTYAKLA